jgi:type I restriction enzyme, S subunit
MRSEVASTLGDFVDLVRGTTYKGALVGKPGPALLGLGSIRPGGGFREDDFKTYGGDCPPKLMLTPGDLFASLKGATKDGEMIGSVARVPASVSSGRLTQDTVKLVFRRRDNDVEQYVYWVLRTPQYRAYCGGRATGSAVVALSRDDFLAYPIPPLTAARTHCVRVLEAIEQRITLLRQTSATVESIAQALFKSWFIDFDPVRAKAEGCEPEGMDPATAALFPAEFEESAVGSIPKGWVVRPLDSIATFLNGLALQKFPAESEDEYLPVVKIAQLRAGNTAGADRASARLKPDYIVNDGDVLFSWSGSLEVEFWCGGAGALNQHLFKVTSETTPKWLYYLATRHYLPSFREIAAHKATTMGHIQRKHLTEAKLALPSERLVEQLGSIVGPLLERRIANSQQARELAAIRDTLLPRLISGKLRLPEVEEQVEAALA